MDSALRPRDIQARIRAGESVEEVALAAGVPAERIDAFAAPVVAEREHVAGLAQIHPVRRRGETTSHRTLRNAVADALAQRGVDPGSVRWDAWKVEDRRWQVLAEYQQGSRRHEALFLYEQGSRFSTAANDSARALIGDDSLGGSVAGRRPASALGSPLVDDELALVRAVQSPASPPAARPTAVPPGASDTPATDADDAEDADDAYLEGELAEVDGLYDILPAEGSNLDVLYDMLSSFDEDSVKIYAGLVNPRLEDTGVIIDAPPGDLGPASPEVGAEPAEASAPLDEPDAESVAGDVPELVETGDAEDTVRIEGDLTPAENTIVIDVPAESGEGEQLSLIGDGATPTAPRRPARRKRASVPSWDEIMFGSPHRDS